MLADILPAWTEDERKREKGRQTFRILQDGPIKLSGCECALALKEREEYPECSS